MYVQVERASHLLGDDGGLLTTGELGQLAEVECDLDQRTESVLSLILVFAGIRLVLLDVQTHGGTLRSCARQADDQARAVLKDNTDNLQAWKAIVLVYIQVP